MPSNQNNQTPLSDALYRIADELRNVANIGMRFSENGYDRERYGQILHLSARLVAAMERRPVDEVYTQYTDNLAHLSPILCVDTAVFREGKILLIRRRDNGLWAMPGGLAEIGESPARAAERELLEEAGMRGQAIRLLGLFDSNQWPAATRMQLYIALFLMQTTDEPTVHLTDELSPHAETLDAGFFAEDRLPPLHTGHDQCVPMAFKLFRGEISTPYFDR